MSDQTDEITDDTQEGQEPNWRRQLEKERDAARTEAQQIKAENESLKRTSAFQEAGFDPKVKAQAFFMEHFKGDLADARAEAEELGILTPQATPVTQDQLLAHSRMDRASQDAAPVAPVGSDQANLDAVLGATDRNDFWVKAKAAGMVRQG